MIPKTKIVAICSIIVTSGCSEVPTPPDCRVDSDYADEYEGNSACLIPMGDSIVTISHRATGKLDLPGGTASPSELAQCTAHRETWEETGINVEVGKLIHHFDSGFRIYLCKSEQEFPYTDKNSQPFLYNPEVASIQLTDPFTTVDSDWRYSNNLHILRKALSEQ